MPPQPAQPYTAESLLLEIAAQGGDALEVDRWFAGGWNSHPRGLPFNDFPMETGRGYFIKAGRPSAWTLAGAPVTAPLTITFGTGWTLLAIPIPAIATARDLLLAIDAQGGNALEVDRWYAGGWNAHVDGLSFNNFALEPARGYFVRTNRASTLVVQ